MRYRELGNTGLLVSEIGMGCEGFSENNCAMTKELFDLAEREGINYFDLYASDPKLRSAVGNALEGRADFELTQKGHRQAGAMAKYVAGNYRITRIYASTLKRAAQTAEHLSEETGIAIEFDPDLMEFNNGLLAGLSHEEADRLYPHVENLPIDQAVYGQESKVEFRSRAENALQRVLSENGSESVIAIVTHGGMVNQLYGALLHMPIGENRFFRTADTGIHIWEITERGSYVIKANMDDHIRGI